MLTILAGWTLAEWQHSLKEDDMPTPAEVAAAVLGATYREYADQDGDGVMDARTVADILYSTHAGVVTLAAGEARRAADQAAQAELLHRILAAAGNPLTEQQFAATLDAMRAAAEQAGQAATVRLEAKLDAHSAAIAAAARAQADALAGPPA
jgi:hypothetical protein